MWKITEVQATDALKQIEGRTNKKIAVVGLGAIGLLLTELAIIEGYTVYVKDVHLSKMEIAITLLPVQTRTQVSQQFSLKKFASGDLLKGGFW